jgi:hypothetical protein
MNQKLQQSSDFVVGNFHRPQHSVEEIDQIISKGFHYKQQKSENCTFRVRLLLFIV